MSGNPVNLTDPTGEFPWFINIAIWGATQGMSFPEALNAVTAMLSNAFAGLVRTIQQNPWLLLFGPFAQGLRVMGSAMAGGVKWVSKGLANAAKTYNNFVYGKDHNCSTVSMCGVRNAGPGLVRGAQLALAATAPWISLLIDPAFTLGFWFSAVGYAVQQVLSISGSPPPVLEYHHGGYVVKNNPLVAGRLGVTFGPFANTGIGATEATIAHEIGHIDQYNKYGGWGYMSRTWLSPFGGAGWAEHNADALAGTSAYPGSDRVNLALMAGFANQNELAILILLTYIPTKY